MWQVMCFFFATCYAMWHKVARINVCHLELTEMGSFAPHLKFGGHFCLELSKRAGPALKGQALKGQG